MVESHCKNCGSQKKGEHIPQKGSDVIPVRECPDCGNVAAVGCDCENPKSHKAGDA